MPLAFWSTYLVKLAIVGAVLALLYAIARKLRQFRFFDGGQPRLLHVVESRMLSPHAAIHVIRTGRRYYLIGTTSAAITTLGEIESAAQGDTERS
ncbi:MAG: flagellar biosynthetic protein FliO [Candidatus Eremiobacteraeota bacterium]|nr:flagellar biosynthetic protein FliO [Candidatus Eremiobacteraeota bacterium]